MQRGQGLSRGRHGEPDKRLPRQLGSSLGIPLAPHDVGVVDLEREDRLPRRRMVKVHKVGPGRHGDALRGRVPEEALGVRDALVQLGDSRVLRRVNHRSC